MERKTRLEALVRFKEYLVHRSVMDTFEEAASAGRQYQELMGPTRCENRSDIIEKYQRGWCWHHKQVERIQMELSLQSLKRGLARTRKESLRLRADTISRLGNPQFLETEKTKRKKDFFI